MTELKRPMLEVTGVSKQYDASEESPVTEVLKCIDLDVASGDCVAIVGPSGCGKSTLVNIIGTLDRPTSGRVQLNGTDLSKLNDRELADVRARHIGLIFQLHHLLPQCSVVENVLVPTLAGGISNRSEPALERAKRLLNRVGLSHRLTHRPGQLSGGEQQRVAVVRALINEPSLVLADEPTGALDQAAADNLADLLLELNREERVTLIVITHSMDLAHRMGRVMRIHDGMLTAVAATQ